MEGDAQPADTGLRRRCWATIAVCVLGVVGLWAVFIRTARGQELDDTALVNRTVDSPRAIAAHGDVLGWITVGSLTLGCLVLLGIGISRRRPLLGIAAVTSIAGAVVTTEFVKRLVIERPDLGLDPDWMATNTFPSGHSTIATASRAAFIAVTPHRWRNPTAVVGAIWVAFQASGVVAAGWHRPSDAVAGSLVALAWGSIVLVGMVRLRRVAPSTAEDLEVERSVGWALVLFAVVVTGLVIGVAASADAPYSWEGLSFVVASITIDAAAIAVVWWYVRLVRGRVLGVAAGTVGELSPR